MDQRKYLDLLNQILDEIVDAIDEARQSGEVMSDDLQNKLADEIDATIAEIIEIETQIAQEEQQRPKEENAQSPQNSQSSQGPTADAQLLWILSGQQEQAFISYLRSFPTESTIDLLNNPTLLSETIDQLSQQMPPGDQPTTNGIQHADLNSSTVWGSAYDPKTGKMRVRFQGGSEYEYDGVPANIYKAFSQGNAEAKTNGQNQYGRWWEHKNPSLGAALNQYIKQGNFRYRKVR